MTSPYLDIHYQMLYSINTYNEMFASFQVHEEAVKGQLYMWGSKVLLKVSCNTQQKLEWLFKVQMSLKLTVTNLTLTSLFLIERHKSLVILVALLKQSNFL